VVLELKGVRKAYGENVVLGSLDLLVERGDRIALVGPNGAGKSTLMRILAGVDRPDLGVRLEGHRVTIDYFAQDQAAALNPACTVYEEMSERSPNTMVPMIRTILGGFLFSGDDVDKKVAVLSGGERNRLALAKMLLRPSNVLLLDEPTNHLDLDSKEVLLDALSDYGGTLIFVSHDRYFVDRLATKVIEVGGGEAPLYPGGYEDFLYWKKQREAGLAAPLPRASSVRHSIEDDDPGAGPPKAPAPSPSPVLSAPKAPTVVPAGKPATPAPGGNGKPVPVPAYDPMAPRLRSANGPPDRQERLTRERELKKMKGRLAELEKRIAEQEKAVKDLEAAMASPGFYEDRARAEQAANDHKSLMWEVGDLMQQWEMLQVEVEERQNALTSSAR
jgi:ATP-binding cassette subfamily F protein 3